MKVALMGASGFVGSRMVEIFHLGDLGELRPSVRNYAGLARLARFDIDWCIADARDEAALALAFNACDAVVHAVAGHLEIIEASIVPTYRAACLAKVRRIVYLSSASVHGQAPPPGTDEATPLSDRQVFDYNNSKVRAERLLLKERARGPVEVVILRPGIVFGPRSRWIAGLADELLRGEAYLVGDGSGICNSIYVDNLVHAIHLALSARLADGEAFLVGDRETVTWADLTFRVASALGVSSEEIHRVEAAEPQPTFGQRVERLRAHKAIQAVLPFIPRNLKRSAKAAIASWREPGQASPWALPATSPPIPTAEMAALHQCRWKFPNHKAAKLLGYEPVVSFEEGCRRSCAWLEFAGYTPRGPTPTRE